MVDPTPEFLIQLVQGDTLEFLFLINSQMMLMLSAQGPHLENYCSRESLLLYSPWSYSKRSRRLTVATLALKILAAVPKLWAAGIAVAWVVLVEGFTAATPAGVGC